MRAKGGIMSFRSAFVVLVLMVVSVINTSCASGEKSDPMAPAYCGAIGTLAASCNSTTPPSGGSSLAVPTEEVRPKVDGDPSQDFPATFQLESIIPSSGVPATAPFMFAWSVRVRMDNVGNAGGSVSFELFPSNDGETPSGPAFGNGGASSGGTGVSPDGSPGAMTGMTSSFTHILVKARWGKNGVGYIYAHTAFSVAAAR